MILCIKTYIIAYVKIQKNEDLLSSMSNLQPNWCLKIYFQKEIPKITHNLQATENFKKKALKKEQQKSEGTH